MSAAPGGIHASDPVAESDRTGGEGGQQGLGLAVLAGHLGIGAKHVLERHQVKAASQCVGRAEPGPELAGGRDVAVVAAGSVPT